MVFSQSETPKWVSTHYLIAMAQQTQSQTDADSGSIAGVLIREVASLSQILDTVDRDEIADMTDEELVELRNELKDLEDTVEDARKDKAEDVLEDRVAPGEKLLGLHRVESHSKYVDDDVGAVIMRAVSEGIDYTEFVDIKASKLDEVAPDIAEIGRAEYTYFR
jgi:hypothetical protein